jgi:hypothetical protein
MVLGTARECVDARHAACREIVQPEDRAASLPRADFEHVGDAVPPVAQHREPVRHMRRDPVARKRRALEPGLMVFVWHESSCDAWGADRACPRHTFASNNTDLKSLGACGTQHKREDT